MKIRTIPVLSALCLCIALTACGPAKTTQNSNNTGKASDVKASWEVVLDTKIDHPSNYEGFIDGKTGYTVGNVGEIHYTRDSGASFPKSDNKSHNVYGLDIVNDEIAWAVGSLRIVRVTTDGGESWTGRTDLPATENQNKVSFIDEKTGWVATDKRLFSTNDGAATWNELKLPEGVTNISAIFVSSPKDGYLLSPDGKFFKTADNGASWSSSDLPFKDIGMNNLKGQKDTLHLAAAPNARIVFTDANNGLAAINCAVEKKGYQTWIFETTDGGASWNYYQLSPKEGFAPAGIFVSRDARFITLSNSSKNVLVLERK